MNEQYIQTGGTVVIPIEIFNQLIEYENNWNELKRWLENEITTIKTTFSQVNGNYFMQNDKIECIENFLDKMQELEEKEVE